MNTVYHRLLAMQILLNSLSVEDDSALDKLQEALNDALDAAWLGKIKAIQPGAKETK